MDSKRADYVTTRVTPDPLGAASDTVSSLDCDLTAATRQVL